VRPEGPDLDLVTEILVRYFFVGNALHYPSLEIQLNPDCGSTKKPTARAFVPKV
jgi:hypothetical protein